VDLLGLDDVRDRLRVVGQAYGGVRPIPVAQIVGSLDRTGDFDRDFRPRRGLSKARIAGLKAAFDGGEIPPIEVHEIGGAFFVADGHHRVALARERGIDFLDAEITRLETNYEVGPDVDVCALVHTEQQRLFMEESGLARARPDAVIEFSRPGGYPDLLEIVKVHGYDLARRRGSLPEPEEVAGDWYDTVFLPGVAAIRAESLAERYAYKTDADLFLWIYQRRRALRVTDATADFTAAAQDAGRQRVSRAFKRTFVKETSRPLPRRR
jgi:hypothetical protein